MWVGSGRRIEFIACPVANRPLPTEEVKIRSGNKHHVPAKKTKTGNHRHDIEQVN
jgi:hypothetical protein